MNACGNRYRNSTAPTTSRTIDCSYSVPAEARAGTAARGDFGVIGPGPGSLRQPVGKPFADGKDCLSVPRHYFHKLRIKMPAGVLLHVDERFRPGPGRLLRAHRRERTVDVGDGANSPFQRG